MTIPVLDEMGYDHSFSAATVAVAGGLGVIIPPSIPFIVYSMASGVSVGDMFLAGIIPGCLIAVCLMAYAIYYCRTKGEDKEKIHVTVKRAKKQRVYVRTKRKLLGNSVACFYTGRNLFWRGYTDRGRIDWRNLFCSGWYVYLQNTVIERSNSGLH